MRVLITGATGFLGTALARRLLDEGDEVRVLARSRSKAAPLVARGAELIEGDVTDAAAVRAAVAGVAVVYHLAGKLYVSGVPASEYQRIHVEGTRTMLAACRAQRGLTRFVHCGTTGVLGATGATPAAEVAPYAPTNAYEATKRDAEVLVREEAWNGFPAVIVRPGLVYGPGDLHLLGFFKAIQRRLFRPIGRETVWFHPIYVDDMIEAFVRCGSDPRAVGECFHIAGREPVTIDTLAATIAGALDVPPPRGHIPLPAARAVATACDALPARLRQSAPLTSSRLDFLTHSRVYSVAKARERLDFSADTPLAVGIGRAADWYRAEGYLPPARVSEAPQALARS
ncbi:MAG: dTDP-glucose 4,6-dehydratase [Ktedonobacterales bacterium]|jgi:nucleoside-diphosphate-sugar epimerase|nr:MAG: dTDP-glucose 4,6-dehydratase [Ktedonobacterales bacterium]